MGAEDWYRSMRWDRRTAKAFEEKLARAKRPNAVQYLRIQGLTLVEEGRRRARRSGAELLERVIADYPDHPSEVAGAHDTLAEYCMSLDDFDGAADHYRAALAASDRAAVEWGSGLSLASLLAADPEGTGDREASTLLDGFADDAGLVFPALRVRYLLARARTDDRLERHDRAAAYAFGLLQMFDEAAAASGDPGDEIADLRSDLQEIVDRGDPAAAVSSGDAGRAPNGSIAWDWELLIRLHA